MTDNVSLIELFKTEMKRHGYVNPDNVHFNTAVSAFTLALSQHEAEQNTARTECAERESTREGHGRMVVGGSSDTLIYRLSKLAEYADAHGESYIAHELDSIRKDFIAAARSEIPLPKGVSVTEDEGNICLHLTEKKIMIIISEDGEVTYSNKENGYYANSSKTLSPTMRESVEVDDLLKENVAEQLNEKSGYWYSCSGCHESGECGENSGNYPYSDTFKCHPGSGCRECGGIGVLWDDTDYSDIIADNNHIEGGAS